MTTRDIITLIITKTLRYIRAIQKKMLHSKENFNRIVPSIFDYMNYEYLSSWGPSRLAFTNDKMEILIFFICISKIVVLKGLF